jgi:hypothetical protein
VSARATQLVVLLAEARIGAELAAAQERGEVATRGNPTGANQHTGNARASGLSTPTLSDLGISSQRASEMRRLAEVGEQRIREEVRSATREARRPSRRQGGADTEARVRSMSGSMRATPRGGGS